MHVCTWGAPPSAAGTSMPASAGGTVTACRSTGGGDGEPLRPPWTGDWAPPSPSLSPGLSESDSSCSRTRRSNRWAVPTSRWPWPDHPLIRGIRWSSAQADWPFLRAGLARSAPRCSVSSRVPALTSYLSGQDSGSIKTFQVGTFVFWNRARECPPRFYHPYLERYDMFCCPAFQVVVFWLTFYF